MTPSGENVPVLLPQVSKYLNKKLPEVAEAMRRKEALYPEETSYWLTTYLKRRRPKVMTQDEFVSCLEYHLARLLDAQGFENIFINGVAKTRQFTIRWHAPATPRKETIA